nr:capsid protein [Cressdnaviricota sp.]
MPFTKRKRSFKTFRARKSFKTGRVGYSLVKASMGRGPFRAVRSGYRRRSMNARVGGLLGIEHKYYDTFKADTQIPSTADWTSCEFNPASTISCLNAITQGDGPTQRDGNVVTIDSIFIQGYCNLQELSAVSIDSNNPSYVRIALVLDTQSRGAELNSEDVYGVVNATATQAVHSPQRNMSYTTRFRVLAEKLVKLRPNSIAALITPTFYFGGDEAHWQMKYEFKGGLKVRYLVGGTTEAIANITDNALFLIMNSNFDSIATSGYCSRIRFRG